MVSAVPAIRCRQIDESDVAAVAALLGRGFPNRNGRFWRRALDELTRHAPPPGLPKYGYLMETGGVPVGAILLICSAMRCGDRLLPRCNLSSWYVEPPYRAYAPLLVAQALRHKQVTYINVSTAPHARPIVEAQGFARYSEGIFVCAPALRRLSGDDRVAIVDARQEPARGGDPFEQQILTQHAAHGCISLWCTLGDEAYPFVFRLRLVKGLIPCARLIYCRDLADFSRFAGPLGRYLLRRGGLFVVVDADRPIPGLFGVFRRGSKPKYFKGPQRPRLGDLAYTEYAILGV